MTKKELSLEHQGALFGFYTEHKVMGEQAVDEDEAIEVLKNVPGIDPVIAAADGHPENIPKSGWLVKARIAPGYSGALLLVHYLETGLVVNHISDDRVKYGSASIGISLEGGKYVDHELVYEPPYFPQKDVEPHLRMSQASYAGITFEAADIIELDNGGRILDDKRPIEIHPDYGDYYLSMTSKEISKGVYGSTIANINRAVEDQKDLNPILAHLGYSMGMTQQGIEALQRIIDKKIATD
jgi:hypothetical protein